MTDYVAHMQQLSKSIEIHDKIIGFALLNRLCLTIANYVTQKQPKDMTELLEAARFTELTNPVSEADSTVSALQYEVHTAVGLAINHHWSISLARAARTHITQTISQDVFTNCQYN